MLNNSRTQLFEHTQRYIREVFSECLRQEGFVSYRDEGIHWYRLVNSEVVHAVYFISRHGSLPAMLEIRYGCHPLFIPPIFQRSPYLYADPGYEQMSDIIPEITPGSTPYGFSRSFIHKSCNEIYRVPDVLIHCPADHHKGLDILEQVFTVMADINTPVACYEAHKKGQKAQIENNSWFTTTSYFADEVLYWEDRPLYPFCMDFISGKSNYLQAVAKNGKLTRKADQEELARLTELKGAFFENYREAYLEKFREREKENLRLLEKYTSIHK